MRLQETPGFIVYKLHDYVYQRGHLEHLTSYGIRNNFTNYDIFHVIGLARVENKVLRDLDKIGFLNYHYLPIADGKLKLDIAERMLQLATALVSDVEQGYAVLSYCNAGRNRSGLMNALILRSLLGVTGKEALEIVRKERPRAVDNIHFEKFLMELG